MYATAALDILKRSERLCKCSENLTTHLFQPLRVRMIAKSLNFWLHTIPLMTAQQQIRLLQQAPWFPTLLRRINLIAKQLERYGRPELLMRRPVYSLREAQIAFLDLLLHLDQVGRLPSCYFRCVPPSPRSGRTCPCPPTGRTWDVYHTSPN